MPFKQAVIALLASAAVALAGNADCPLSQQVWGAIRWDAFYTPQWNASGDAAAAVANTLSPPRWHDRLPWYSTVDPATGNITFNDADPSVMDTEITMAVSAGLSYWAFDVYPPDNLLSAALNAYLASTAPAKANLSFALLLQTSWMTDGGLAAWPDKVAIYAAHFARQEYCTVLGNRPLVYLFSVTEAAWGNASAGWSDWATALSMLANASIAAGRGAPYVVLQTWDASQGASQLEGINAAAAAHGSSSSSSSSELVSGLSAYALGGATPSGTPWATFAAAGASFWDSLAATGHDAVLPVAAGWDTRPRAQTPPPWDPNATASYVIGPTPLELAAFVSAASAWTAAHPASNPACLHLLSAWNEYDEGHWIGAVLPQYGGNARLDAIGAVLRPA